VFKAGVKRADKSNAIDLYVTSKLPPAALFETLPVPLTNEEKSEWMKGLKGVVVSSDAFFPFSDNIDRAGESGVEVVAAPGGSKSDDVVVQKAEEKGIVVIHTAYRLFHH
jgi:phosphoribosylaminoimidazolecarboxamide formyltransferase/IMP cyclohydrolase